MKLCEVSAKKLTERSRSIVAIFEGCRSAVGVSDDLDVRSALSAGWQHFGSAAATRWLQQFGDGRFA